MDQVFQFFFKYRPMVFQRGDLVFDAAWPGWITPVLLLLAAGIAFVPYVRLRTGVRPVERWVLAAARFVAFGLVVFSLTRPVLVIATVVPQQNTIGILLDDSRSMTIPDAGAPRSQAVADLLGTGQPLVDALAQRFKLRFYRFSGDAARVASPEALTYTGGETDLASALAYARRDLASGPTAGLVVLTDGADNGQGSLDETLLELKAAGVPVYPVGLGRERVEPDIEVERVAAPAEALAGATIAVDVTLQGWGYGRKTVKLNVEDASRIVASKDVELEGDGRATTARLNLTLDERGSHRLRVVVPPVSGELLNQNNTLDFVVDVRDARDRVLYMEGEPRFEVKFILRAIADDSNVEVVALLRTAPEKFLRLNVKDSVELVSGFPTSRRELFKYRGLILGSVEASFFTHDQLQMIADFVSQRGGGLLVLGGQKALGEGGWGETPLAAVWPVEIAAHSPQDSSTFFAEVRPKLTELGRAHPALQLNADPERSAQRWQTLPALSMVNPITRAKPGASTLLLGERARGDPLIMLAYQRFGSGKAIAFPVQDSWVWQMHADIPLEDQTHETLWRQLLRWLVSDVPQPVSASAGAGVVELGRSLELHAAVRDSDYLALNGAEVVATVRSPDGAERFVPLEWTVERNGEYRAPFVPAAPGLYEVDVTARQQGAQVGTAVTHFYAGDLGTEYRGAGLRTALLQRLATETGGRYYTPSTAQALAEDVSFTTAGASVLERRALWNMPIIFLLLLGLLGGEWAYRRVRGLP